MERLSIIELNDYCDNAGLTNLQKDILRLKYFDEHNYSVLQICHDLSISESSFYRNQRKLLSLIYKYESHKKK